MKASTASAATIGTAPVSSGVTETPALRHLFRPASAFWLNLQNEYDLRRAVSPALKRIAPRAA